MTTILDVARAEALFLSRFINTNQPLTRADADAAIRETVRRCHGVKGCHDETAAYFGNYTEVAVPRMRWALETVESLYHQPRCACRALRTHKTLVGAAQ